MPNLERVNMICPMCSQTFYTYVEHDKLHILRSPNRPHMQELFRGYDPNYREVFITNYCDNCQEVMFGRAKINYTLPENATSAEDSKLQADICRMIENASRQ